MSDLDLKALAANDADHPADIEDPKNELSLGDKVELADGKVPDTLK